MSIYAHIKRCLELADRDIASAVADRRLTKALLDQLAKVSRPADGAPKLLMVFAHMASTSVDWIDGALRVEMVGDADVTVVEVLSELGLGMHERVFPSFKMGVPLDEFVRAVERVPHMIAPLTIATQSNRRLVLTAAVDDEEQDEAPEAAPRAAVSIGDDSLYGTGERRRTSKDKLAAVMAPGTRIQSRTSSSSSSHPAHRKPEMGAVLPRIIAPNSGKTLRPTAPVGDVSIAHGPPPPPSTPEPAIPKPPLLPRAEERPRRPSTRPSIVARVPLVKMQVPRGGGVPVKAPAAPRASKRSSLRPAAKGASVRPATKRASVKPATKGASVKPAARGASVKPAAKGASVKPAAKGASVKPPSKRASMKPTSRTSKSPPARGSAPPKSTRGRPQMAISEPPDEEGIDSGWDDSNE